MTKKTLLKNAQIVNDGIQVLRDILIEDERISKIGKNLSHDTAETLDLEGAFLLPGVIDDQVHFREPGLTHKGNLETESKAAALGGVTTYMEMPNTNPQTIDLHALENKWAKAKAVSSTNYSFFFGATNDNAHLLKSLPIKYIPGVKVFMGSSTGNMLVDQDAVLERIFSSSPVLIATHCEDEATVRANTAQAIARFGENIPMSQHPIIRDEEACYLSSSKAVALAKTHNARLHILHISTAKELELFTNNIPLEEKKITAEACIHHLHFSNEDYAALGSKIKWNPAVKHTSDREAIWAALLDNRIDVVATDHAPHTQEEKANSYLQCPSGGPLIQHSLPLMMQKVEEGRWSIEQLVEKMCHAPARLFSVKERGYIREGYFADLVVLKKQHWTVSKENIAYKCGWSPLENTSLDWSIDHTFINGEWVVKQGRLTGLKRSHLAEYSR